MKRQPGFAAATAAVLTGLFLGPSAALAEGVDAAAERLKALEETVRELRQEVDRLKGTASGAGKPSVAPAGDNVSRRELEAVKGEGQDLREEVKALQSRVDSQVPNVRLGEGLVIEDPRGRWALRATARMQFDYRTFDNTGGMADTFAMRRGRTGLGLSLAKLFTLYVEAEHSLGSGTQSGTAAAGALHQGYIDFTPAESVRLRVGQFKPQFGLENTMTTWQHDFQERSLAANLVQASQNNVLFDRGLMITAMPAPGVQVGVSVTNGTGTNLDEFQRASAEARANGKDLTVRATGNAAAWTELQGWVLHVGFNYKGGELANYCPPAGTISATNPCGFTAPSAITESRSITFFNPRPFNAQGSAQAASSIDRVLKGIEAAVAYRQWKLQFEWFDASYKGAPASGGSFERGIETGYVAANWLVTGEHFADVYRNGIFGRIRPDNQFGTGPGSGWGAVELGLRFSFWDGRDFVAGPSTDVTGVLGPNTLAPAVSQSTDRANAWTVALKWMPTAYTAFLLNLVRTNFGGPVVANGVTLDHEQALILRAQFDVF